MSDRRFGGPILVTGGAGQVARALAAAAAGRPVLRVGREAVDFDRPDLILPWLRDHKPGLIVNAAAYTSVDRAESEPEAADRANRDGPARLAAYAAEAGIALIHISTDYVFDGLKGAPYVETDLPTPTGVYGRSKLAGEQAVAASGARAIVLRTSWVYAEAGRNFVLTMLNAAKKMSQLRVVADQRGCPTAAADLAAAILAIADRLADGWDDRLGGLYHAAGEGETTWHGLAEAVFARAERHGLTRPTVTPIATADWPTPARRPPDSRLACDKLHRSFGVRLPDWHDSLTRTVDAIFA
jgi:dTDP-4-dehydrorhamnose reductase